jgi:hypothetical protein
MQILTYYTLTILQHYNFLMNCGFIPVNTKAIRMQGGVTLFIDHILVQYTLK